MSNISNSSTAIRKKSQKKPPSIKQDEELKTLMTASIKNLKRPKMKHGKEEVFKLVEDCLQSLCPLFLIKFLFIHQMTALQKLRKVFFISSKKLFSFSRYSNFCHFSPSFPHFPDTKGQREVK